jgi:hypothetical protein
MLGGHFPLAGAYPHVPVLPEGVTCNGRLYYKDGERVELRAVATGERRAPEAGEWYLSGAIVEAYYTRHALPMGCVYPIARIVAMRRRWEVA